MQRGLRHNPKPKEAPAPRGPDLSTTSRARKALNLSKRTATPEEHAKLEAQVSEAHPDMLIDRRGA